MANPTDPNNPTPATPPTGDQQPDQSDMLDVFSPEGDRGQIPASMADTAFRDRKFKMARQDDSGNWTPVQPSMVTSPEGEPGWLAHDKVFDAITKRGFTIGQPLPKTAGDKIVNGKFTPGNPQPSNIGTAGIDPYLEAAWPKVKDAAASVGKVLKTGGKTLLKIAADPTPAGIGAAFGDEAAEQMTSGGIPNSPEILKQPLRELAGERQPNESVTLGFTKQASEQQPLLTRTANAMSSVMGGDPAGARVHFARASDAVARGDHDTANQENQAGIAALTAVPLATVGLGRLVGSTANKLPGLASETVDAASRAATVTKLRTFPQAALSPAESFTRVLSPGKVLKGGSSENLLNLHDAVQSSMPRIQSAADSMGLKIATADDLQSAIEQAKSDLFAEHQKVLGPGDTLADLGPEQFAQFKEDFDALNSVQSRVVQLQVKEAAKAAKLAAKGKSVLPPTTTENVGKIGTGLGKVALGQVAARAVPFGGTLARAGMRAAGITSGFSDVAAGMGGLMGRVPNSLDAAIERAFSPNAPDLVGSSARRALDEASGRLTPPPELTRPEFQSWTGDLSVPHESNIAPPELPHGDAGLFPVTGRVPRTTGTSGPGGVPGAISQAADASSSVPEPLAAVASPQPPPLSLPPMTMPAQADSSLAAEISRRGIEAVGIPGTAENTAIRNFIASHPDLSPQQARQVILNHLDAGGSVEDLGGLGEVQTGVSPATSVGKRLAPRTTSPGPITLSKLSDPLNLAPDPGFRFTHPMHGESAAADFLSSQTLGKLKTIANARNIPFDGRTDPNTLRQLLVRGIVGDLRDDELQNFENESIERSRFPRPSPSKKAVAAGAYQGASARPQDFTDILQQSIDAVNAAKAARSGGVPQPIADVVGAGERRAGPPRDPTIDNSRITEFRRQLLNETDPAKIAELNAAIAREQSILASRTPQMEQTLRDLSAKPPEGGRVVPKNNIGTGTVYDPTGIPGPITEAASASSGVPEIISQIASGQGDLANVSGHAGPAASLEELSRGRTLKVSPRSGSVSAGTDNIDVGDGEAAFRQRPDGTLELANNASGANERDLLDQFGSHLAQVFGNVTSDGRVVMIHNQTGAVGTMPIEQVGHHLSTGEYRLAPRTQPQSIPSTGNEPPKPISDLIAPRISVIHPNGTTGTVPRDQLSAAISEGYQLAQPLTAQAA